MHFEAVVPGGFSGSIWAGSITTLLERGEWFIFLSVFPALYGPALLRRRQVAGYLGTKRNQLVFPALYGPALLRHFPPMLKAWLAPARVFPALYGPALLRLRG